jgi:hypothetical protein
MPQTWTHARLQIKGDARAICSSKYGSKYSIRFPRITAIRQDLGLHDVKTSSGLEATIEQMAGSLAQVGGGKRKKLFRK